MDGYKNGCVAIVLYNFGNNFFCNPKDLYGLLGVKADATEQEIKAAYKRQAFLWHPDRAPDDKKKDYELRMQAINFAYRILTDVEKRALYNAKGYDFILKNGIKVPEEKNIEESQADDDIGEFFKNQFFGKNCKGMSLDGLVSKSLFREVKSNGFSCNKKLASKALERKDDDDERLLHVREEGERLCITYELRLEDIVNGKKISLESLAARYRLPEGLKLEIPAGLWSGDKIVSNGIYLNNKKIEICLELIVLEHPLYKVNEKRDVILRRPLIISKREAINGTALHKKMGYPTTKIPNLHNKELELPSVENGQRVRFKGAGLPIRLPDGKYRWTDYIVTVNVRSE
ncbi:MAG: DnaJ domain-containing protein [Candidatus Woesearchaeota archaeon]